MSSKEIDEGFINDTRPVTLAELKRFLNLEGIDYDDEILLLTLDTAISYCNKYNETEYTKYECPQAIKQAILAFAAHLFENRTGTTSQSEKAVLDGVHRILNLHREKFTL